MAVYYMKPEHRFMGSTVSQTLCDCQCKHIAFIQTFLLADVKIHMFCSSNSKFFKFFVDGISTDHLEIAQLGRNTKLDTCLCTIMSKLLGQLVYLSLEN